MVLQKALSYLDGLAKDSAGDMSLQMDLARAYVRVGELQSSNLGDTLPMPQPVFGKAGARQSSRAASAAGPCGPQTEAPAGRKHYPVSVARNL